MTKTAVRSGDGKGMLLYVLYCAIFLITLLSGVGFLGLVV